MTANDTQDVAVAAEKIKSELESREDSRSHRPSSPNFKEFMASNWAERPPSSLSRQPVADFLSKRHQRAGEPFAGDRLVFPAGTFNVRGTGTDHRFRADSDFIYLTGLVGEMEPDAVLVLDPTGASSAEAQTHRATLYFQPRSSRSSEEFYADSRYGEFWVGARPSLDEMAEFIGLTCAPLDALPGALAENLGSVGLRVMPGVDSRVETMVKELRSKAGVDAKTQAELDSRLSEHLSELRLIKDAFEVEQIQMAVDVTKRGFDRMLRALPRAIRHPRGERVLEAEFAATSREEGNSLGYETIIAAGDHANILHWSDNSGDIPEGSLILIDAGIEIGSLYTGDITRTVPANGTFSPIQSQIYEAVLAAAEAAFQQANVPGARFRDIHQAAMEVIAGRLEQWGILPVSAAESLRPSGQQHRRWMPHGTGHHLGLDVHDCAKARPERYLAGRLEPGMVFTIEPGLYFRSDDLTVPEEFRGIGIRIEDNIVIGPDGTARRLSESIPRTVAEVEEWIRSVQAEAE